MRRLLLALVLILTGTLLGVWLYIESRLSVIGAIFAGVQIVVGFGLDRRWPWARRAALGFCICLPVVGALVPMWLLGMGVEATGRSMERMAPIPGVAWLVAFIVLGYAIVASIICLRGLKYLLDYDGRIEFGARTGEHGALRDESRGMVWVSVLAWAVAGVVAAQTFTVPGQSWPYSGSMPAVKSAPGFQSSTVPVPVADSFVLGNGDEAMYSSEERIVCPMKAEILVRDYQIKRASGEIDTVYVTSNAGKRTFASRGAALDEGCRIAMQPG